VRAEGRWGQEAAEGFQQLYVSTAANERVEPPTIKDTLWKGLEAAERLLWRGRVRRRWKAWNEVDVVVPERRGISRETHHEKQTPGAPTSKLPRPSSSVHSHSGHAVHCCADHRSAA
jgi:hypothetical protein